MQSRIVIGVLGVCLTAAIATAADDGSTKLLRFPDIHGGHVVFSYGGDLWLASDQGGAARRLTAHPGLEVFPRFSPDGRWIAFTGQYDGDEQVYVIPSEGGEPERLTWYPAAGPLPPRAGFDHQVHGWTPDGEKILFRSMREANNGTVDGRLYTVPRTGGLPTALPMPNSGAGDFSPDGTRMVYSPLFRDFRHWKRYQGGWAQNLYLFDLATAEVRPLAHSPRTERDPMWIGDTVYFVSDRDDRLNLYAADPVTGEVEQLTFSDPWDVRWPATDHAGRIVYELNGTLRVLDVATRTDRALDITVPDDGLWKRPRRIAVSDQIEDFALSPKGERALFVARGEVFSAPAEHGPTRNLTRSSGARDRAAAWSPDGTTVAYLSDAGGEDRIWLVDQAGQGEPRALTEPHDTRIYGLGWAPDGERIAYSDAQGRLWAVRVDGAASVLVADDPWGAIGDPDWSPDGAFLAFTLRNPAGFSAVHVWSAADGRLRQVTSDLFNTSSPSWSPNGDYLFYIAEHHHAPQISSLEWNYAGNERDGIYALALRRDVEPILPPRSDEVSLEEEDENEAEADEKSKKDEKSKTDGKSKADAKSPEPVKIDFDGLGDRVMALPVEPGNYSRLEAVDGHLLYASSGAFFYGRGPARPTSLHLFSFEKRESSELVSGVRGSALSADGKKLLVRTQGGFQLYDVKPGDGKPTAVSTAGLEMDLDPEAEWRQIFDETWRQFRDFFYVDNMHGYDWPAIGERYRALLDHVVHRSDLNYVLTEMVSELNAGHTYISGGDFEIPERPSVGLPGARFELDAAAGRYRIARILPGHNQQTTYRSPLTEVGVDAREGDYVLAIQGRELTAGDNPYRLLQHLTDPVTLTLNDRPTPEGAREVTYRPVASESSLNYLAWVVGNLERVTAMTDGRVGYLHIPDMGADGIAEFIKWFYPQIRKEGLVVDVRSNGGGNVSQMIIERLDTRVLGTRFGRTSELPSTYPSTAFHGHLACLISETSASDGDIFPYYFREAGLGPLIGKRTWGGVVGGGYIPLVDGGSLFIPRSATNDLEGEYIIEGVGVAPDIEVENDPASVLAGRDPQLERGVREILAAIERDPRALPERPEDPVKTPAR